MMLGSSIEIAYVEGSDACIAAAMRDQHLLEKPGKTRGRPGAARIELNVTIIINCLLKMQKPLPPLVSGTSPCAMHVTWIYFRQIPFHPISI